MNLASVSSISYADSNDGIFVPVGSLWCIKPEIVGLSESVIMLPRYARQLPILDVTWCSCFLVPSPRPSYIGETVLNPCHSVGCEDFSEIVVSSSIRRLFVFIRFWFDFIYFVLRSHDSSEDFSLIRGYLHAVCWIVLRSHDSSQD